LVADRRFLRRAGGDRAVAGDRAQPSRGGSDARWSTGRGRANRQDSGRWRAGRLSPGARGAGRLVPALGRSHRGEGVVRAGPGTGAASARATVPGAATGGAAITAECHCWLASSAGGSGGARLGGSLALPKGLPLRELHATAGATEAVFL